jgi:hypothetical protein
MENQQGTCMIEDDQRGLLSLMVGFTNIFPAFRRPVKLTACQVPFDLYRLNGAVTGC